MRSFFVIVVHAHDNEAAMLEGVMIPLGFSVQEEILF